MTKPLNGHEETRQKELINILDMFVPLARPKILMRNETVQRLKYFLAERGLWQDYQISSAINDFEEMLANETEKNNSVIETVLPEKAPELYKFRTDTSEDGPAFYNRVYKDHIGNGLTRAVLDKLDHPLVARIDALKRKGDAAALDLDLPTAWIAPQQWAKRVLAGEETLPPVADASTLSRNAARLVRERKRQSEPQK